MSITKEGVLALQALLSEAGHAPGPIDGLWGKKTEAAVKSYLAQRGRPTGSDDPTKPTPPLDARSQKNLVGVHKDLVAVVERAWSKAPGRFMVIEGLRTPARQKELYAQGATTTLNSRHLTGHAVDVVPLDDKGTIRWDWPLYRELAPLFKQAAAELKIALDWGGDWKSFPDGPHWELRRSVYPA